MQFLMTSEKDHIRQHAKRFRDQLQISPDWAGQAADLLFERVNIPQSAVVAVYYPIGKEIDPSPIVEKLWEKNIQVCLPIIINDQRTLAFAAWSRDTPLIDSRFGTRQPRDITETIDPDILIVPLLAFDQRGNRMGYGQGNYDATLADLRARKSVLAIGLAYAEQAVLLALPTEPHDQKLDMVVTPQRIFDFRD
jgi:5-formyltetrahydrofolate cyclo-ligase